MIKIILLIVGILGLLLSTCVVAVSVSLPIINGPRTSWSEAMMGIVPGAACCTFFLMVTIVALVLMLLMPRNGGTDSGDRDPATPDRD